jgi:hypothetical protein
VLPWRSSARSDPGLFRAFGELVRWCSHPPVRNLQPEARVRASACSFSQPQRGDHAATPKAKSIWGVGCSSVPRAPPARLPRSAVRARHIPGVWSPTRKLSGISDTDMRPLSGRRVSDPDRPPSDPETGFWEISSRSVFMMLLRGSRTIRVGVELHAEDKSILIKAVVWTQGRIANHGPPALQSGHELKTGSLESFCTFSNTHAGPSHGCRRRGRDRRLLRLLPR